MITVLETRGSLRAVIEHDDDPMTPDEWTDDTDAPEWDQLRSGDVWIWGIQQLVHWTSDDPASFPHHDTWEWIDSVGSCYGYEYAAGEARAELESLS